MNEEIKAEWVETLRSGELKQAQKRLHLIDREGNHSYCCLGVLCKIAIKHGWRPKIESRTFTRTDPDYLKVEAVAYDGDVGVLPVSVMEWVGLKDRVGMFGIEDSLASQNDRGATFNKIADIIEREF